MSFPLSALDIGLWLAVTAMILLTTSELLASTTVYLSDVAMDRNRLRLVAIGLGVAFTFTVVLQALQHL